MILARKALLPRQVGCNMVTANNDPHRRRRSVHMYMHFKYTDSFLLVSMNPLKKNAVPSPDLWCSRCWAAGSVAFLGEGGFEFLILQPQSD